MLFRCECGRPRGEHDFTYEIPRQSLQQFIHLPTDAYGKIEFTNQVHGFRPAEVCPIII